MKIDINKGYYCFRLDEAYVHFNIAPMSIMEAKESYLRFIENLIDEAIDDNMIKLSQLENEED